MTYGFFFVWIKAMTCKDGYTGKHNFFGKYCNILQKKYDPRGKSKFLKQLKKCSYE